MFLLNGNFIYTVRACVRATWYLYATATRVATTSDSVLAACEVSSSIEIPSWSGQCLIEEEKSGGRWTKASVTRLRAFLGQKQVLKIEDDSRFFFERVVMTTYWHFELLWKKLEELGCQPREISATISGVVLRAASWGWVIPGTKKE